MQSKIAVINKIHHVTLRRRVLAVVNYCYQKNNGKSPHYRDITNVFERRFHKQHSPETIPRYMRHLRKEGILAGTEGFFAPVKAWLPDVALRLYERDDL